MLNILGGWSENVVIPANSSNHAWLFSGGTETGTMRNQIQAEQPQDNYFKEDIPVLPEIASALLIAGNVLVLIFAWCGNIAAVIVCLWSKFNRHGTRFFLISLALSDLLLALSSIVVSLSQLLTPYHAWSLGDFLCRTSDYVQTFAMTLNGFSLLAIAIDRCLAVVRGLKQPCLSPTYSRILTGVFMAGIWLVSLCVPIPMLFVYYNRPFWVWGKTSEDGPRVSDEITRYWCTKHLEFQKDNSLVLTYYGLLGVLSLAIVIAFVYSYVSILIFLRRNFRCHPRDLSSRPISSAFTARHASHSNEAVMSRGNSTNTATCQSRGRRTLHLLLALVSLYLICRIPIWVTLIYWNFSPNYTVTGLCMRYSLSLLSTAKSAINPFVYTIWNSALRSQHQDYPTRNPQMICFCFDTSGECYKRFPANFWTWCACRSPRTYDFTAPEPRTQPSFDSPLNTRCFTISNRTDGRVRLTTSSQDSNELNTSTSKI